MLHANLKALSVIEPELCAIEVLHSSNRNFQRFWLLWPWPWPDDLQLTRIAWRYTVCANTNFVRQGFWKLSSDRHTLYNVIQTDTTDREFVTSAKKFAILTNFPKLKKIVKIRTKIR